MQSTQMHVLTSLLWVSLALWLQGTQIQGSFWREAADKYFDSLQEGKVCQGGVTGTSAAQWATVQYRASMLAAGCITLISHGYAHGTAIAVTDKDPCAKVLSGKQDMFVIDECMPWSQQEVLNAAVARIAQVYYFTNFSVKPANKQYATVRNDYQLNFDSR